MPKAGNTRCNFSCNMSRNDRLQRVSCPFCNLSGNYFWTFNDSGVCWCYMRQFLLQLVSQRLKKKYMQVEKVVIQVEISVCRLQNGEPSST